MAINSMHSIIDHHTHIGTFYNTCYDYKTVFTALKKCNVSEITCAHLTPKFESSQNAVHFYNETLTTLQNAKTFSKSLGFTVHFLAWLDPLVLECISLEKICSDFSYSGFALHPMLHEWAGVYEKLLTLIFNYADKNALGIFLHTGVSFADNPTRFEKWFRTFPNVSVRLAHCKDAATIIPLFEKYKNLSGDTAFCPHDSFDAICNAGFRSRMYFGTDFPITHWWQKQHDTAPRVSESELVENYKEVAESKRYEVTKD